MYKDKEKEKAYERMRSKLPHRRELNKRKMWFKNDWIYPKKNPRTGICSMCGYKGLTHIHHDEYHAENPLANTRELCPGCHNIVRNQPRDSVTGRFIKG